MHTILLIVLWHLSNFYPSPKSIAEKIAERVDSTLRGDSIELSDPPLVPFGPIIDSLARLHTLPPALLAGVIQEESRFDEWASRVEPRYMNNTHVLRAARIWTSAHGAIPNRITEASDRSRSYGLMQIMGETAREQGFTGKYLSSLYLPAHSIDQGARLLRRLLLRYHGDTLAAISAYNQGSARKRRGAFVNARYVYRVVLAWRMYEQAFVSRTMRKEFDSCR